jgi:hypothetical protein
MAEFVVPIPERYVRTNGGLTVHRPDCPHAKRARHVSDWRWAEGMTPDEIVAYGEPRGLHYHWCATCLPWTELSDG